MENKQRILVGTSLVTIALCYIFVYVGLSPWDDLDLGILLIWLPFGTVLFAITQAIILTFSLIRYRQGNQYRDLLWVLMSMNLLILGFMYMLTHPVYSDFLPQFASREKNRTVIILLAFVGISGISLASYHPRRSVNTNERRTRLLLFYVIFPIISITTFFVPDLIILTNDGITGTTIIGYGAFIIVLLVSLYAEFRFIMQLRDDVDILHIATFIGLSLWITAAISHFTQNGPYQLWEIVWFSMIIVGMLTISVSFIIDVIINPQRPLIQRLDQTYKELEESESKYRALVENSIQGILILRLEPIKILFANKAFTEMVGYSSQEIIAFQEHQLANVTIPDDLDEITKLISHESSYRTRIRLVSENGTIIWSDTSSVLIEYDGESVYLITFNDITQQYEAEQSLEKSEQKLEMAIAGANLGVWDWFAKKGRFEINDRYAEILGYSKNELPTDSLLFEKLVHPEDYERMLKLWNSHVDTKTSLYTSQHRMQHKDGHYIWVLEAGRVLERTEQGRTKRALGTILDITDLVKAQEESRIAANIATFYLDLMTHDIRNQLQVMLMAAGVIEERIDSQLEEKALRNITDSIDACQTLISGVYSTRGLLEAPLEQRSLRNELENTLEEIRLRFEEVLIHAELIDSPAYIFADDFITVLLANILKNSILHNDEHPPQIWIHLEEDEDGYLLEIADNGNGISDRRKDSLFDPGRRFGGIGLHQARRIVEKYNGQIRVVDRVPGDTESGAKFELKFQKLEKQDIIHQKS